MIPLQALPEELALEYSRQKVDGDNWRVQDIMRFIMKEVHNRERTIQIVRPYSRASLVIKPLSNKVWVMMRNLRNN